jgi:hypothetical protein
MQATVLKLTENRLRRICDRRKGHGDRASARTVAPLEPVWEPTETSGATAGVRTALAERDTDEYQPPAPELDDHLLPIAMEGDGPVVLREKFHKAEPMTVEQALFEMELVGHDFFLFRDTQNGKPSVVYRRRGWDYGVIRLVES